MFSSLILIPISKTNHFLQFDLRFRKKVNSDWMLLQFVFTVQLSDLNPGAQYMYKVGLRNDVKSFSNEVFCSNKGYLFSRTLKFNLFIKIQTKTALLTRSLVYCYIVCNEKFKKLILTKLTLFFFLESKDRQIQCCSFFVISSFFDVFGFLFCFFIILSKITWEFNYLDIWMVKTLKAWNVHE